MTYHEFRLRLASLQAQLPCFDVVDQSERREVLAYIEALYEDWHAACRGDTRYKTSLQRVRINSQGYEAGGRYWGWGAGRPLYRAEVLEADGQLTTHTLRARDRTEAKGLVQKFYRSTATLVFYR